MDVGQHVGQVAVGVGADDERHVVLLLHQLVFQPLGHATQYAYLDPGVLALQGAELAQAFAYALLGIVADGAGVDEYVVGGIDVLHYLIVGFEEYGPHNFAVGKVHLAPVGFYVYFVFQFVALVFGM